MSPRLTYLHVYAAVPVGVSCGVSNDTVKQRLREPHESISPNHMSIMKISCVLRTFWQNVVLS
eukprot:1953970-Amphidinium_carterae.1